MPVGMLVCVRFNIERLREEIKKLPPGEDLDDAYQLLDELERGMQKNPLYSLPQGFPYAQQEAFLKSNEHIKMFAGGNRSGKTTAGLIDDLIQALDREAVPSWLQKFKHWEPPFYCRIISLGFRQVESVINEKLRNMVPQDQLLGGSWEKAFSKQDMVLRFKNGSWFQFLTADQDVGKHAGVALDRVHFDEEPPGDQGYVIFGENKMRVTDREGQIMLTMTPMYGLTWAYDEIYSKQESPNIFVAVASIDDNPGISARAKDLAFEGMTKEQVASKRHGQFIHFEGLVYSEFDEEKHLVDPQPQSFLKGKHIFVGIDPGIVTTGVVFCAVDEDGSIFVFDEIYAHDTPIAEAERSPGSGEPADGKSIARLIHAKLKYWGVRPLYYVIDPAARSRGLTNAETVVSALLRNDIYCIPGQNDREAGVFLVKQLLLANKLTVSRACQNLLWERGRYRYARKTESPQAFATVKRDDHLLDALRYACMSAAWGVPKPELPRNRFAPDPVGDCPTGMYT